MRFELAGSVTDAPPLTVPFETSGDFDTEAYLALGYTNFDVICIGGGGGRGGGVDTANTGTLIRTYGGEGGGGGLQRVRGPLSALPDTVPVVVGAAGTPGTEHPSNPSATSDGGNGGASSFNTDTCRASGGKGGKRACPAGGVLNTTSNTLADGGEGGIGNTTVAGGGGTGGHCGDPDDDPSTSTDGADGPIIDNIGHGGGGGAGGIFKYDGTSYLEATRGGNGSYDPDNLLLVGPGEDPRDFEFTETVILESVRPGRGGGGNASPVNVKGLTTVYGQAGTPGAVIILLTAE